MKKTFLMIFLGFGLITLAACTGNKQSAESNLAPNLTDEARDSAVEIREASFLDGKYEVNSEASVLTWHGSRVIASDHTGLVSVKSGNLEVIDAKLVGGEFVMDLTTITSDEGIDRLVTHLKSADFFNVDTYPEAKLVINSVTPGPSAYSIAADLTIKDVTAPIVFNADLSQVGETMSASAEFTIDRTIWNIRYDSGQFFQDLGDKAIKDDITFGVSLVANLQ
jgi:polyisoprenoid-binding protein YceI